MGVGVRTKRRGGSSVARALAVSDVGTWTWHIADDVLRCDPVAATMLGLPRTKSGSGTTFGAFLDRIHPEDQRRIASILDDLRRQGGLYIAQYRTVPEPGEVRWILARGRFILDPEGGVSEAHGIVIDVTDSRTDSRIDGPAHFLAAFETSGSVLERIADNAIEACDLIRSLDADKAARLRLLVDALLHELGRQLAASLHEDAARPAISRGSKVH